MTVAHQTDAVIYCTLGVGWYTSMFLLASGCSFFYCIPYRQNGAQGDQVCKLHIPTFNYPHVCLVNVIFHVPSANNFGFCVKSRAYCAKA